MPATVADSTMKKVSEQPTAILLPMPRPNHRMNSGASAMRGITFSALKYGSAKRSSAGQRTNTRPTAKAARLPITKDAPTDASVQPRSVQNFAVPRLFHR
ncbi:hypothetical protein D3C85_1218880 [compost metagenome]